MNLSKTIHYSLCLLFSFAVLTGCKKDDPEPEETNTPTDSSQDGGDLTSTVNGNAFSSNSATARFRSTGEFTIRANNDNNEEIFIIIENFIGPADYSFGPGLSNSARYRNVVGGQPNYFSTVDGGSGMISITNYDESSQTIAGEFFFTATGVSSTSIDVVDGEYSQLPITELEMPAEGEAAFYLDDVRYEAEIVTAHINVVNGLEVELYNPITENIEFDYSNYIDPTDTLPNEYRIVKEESYYNSLNSVDIESNENMSQISGHIKVAGTDIEIRFNKITVSDPMQASVSTAKMKFSEETFIEFDNVTLTNQTGFIQFEGENAAGYEFRVVQSAWEPMLFWGTLAMLDAWDDSGSSITSNLWGAMTFEIIPPQLATVGYLSDNGLVEIHGFEVDYIE